MIAWNYQYFCTIVVQNDLLCKGRLERCAGLLFSYIHIVQVQPTLINCLEQAHMLIPNLHGHALLDFFCKNATKSENKSYILVERVTNI